MNKFLLDAAAKYRKAELDCDAISPEEDFQAWKAAKKEADLAAHGLCHEVLNAMEEEPEKFEVKALIDIKTILGVS